MDKIKVIYLMGMGRSGGTIIGRILGQYKNSLYVGELRYLWQRGIKENWDCSCGKKFSECIFWTKIIKRIRDKYSNNEIDELIRIQEKFDKTSKFFITLSSIKKNNINSEELKKYKYFMYDIYTIISEESNVSTIVESSRFPSRALALSTIEGIDFYAIHLIRDPRGVINSQIKETFRNFGIKQRWPIKRMINWVLNNILSYISKYLIGTKRYLLIRYEEFCDNPSNIIKRMLNFCNYDASEFDIINNAYIDLKSIHVFSANENRFRVGKIKIEQDTKWKNELAVYLKIIILVFILPFYYLIRK